VGRNFPTERGGEGCQASDTAIKWKKGSGRGRKQQEEKEKLKEKGGRRVRGRVSHKNMAGEGYKNGSQKTLKHTRGRGRKKRENVDQVGVRVKIVHLEKREMGGLERKKKKKNDDLGRKKLTISQGGKGGRPSEWRGEDQKKQEKKQKKNSNGRERNHDG